MALSIPIPTKSMPLSLWIGCLSTAFPRYILPSAPRHEKNWREWAASFIKINNIITLYPFKYQFPKDSDWRTWAFYFIRTVQR